MRHKSLSVWRGKKKAGGPWKEHTGRSGTLPEYRPSEATVQGVYMNLKELTGKEIVNFYLKDGFSLQEIADFLCDGEALEKEGITDQCAVEAAFDAVVPAQEDWV